MRFHRLIPMALAGAMLVGCAGDKAQKTQKQAANEQWNATRAAVLTGLANDQYKSGSFDKCRVTLNEATKLDPENANIRVLSAKLAIEQGQLDQASQELQTAKRLNPNLAEAWYLSGVVHQRWQRPEVAFENYQRASQISPSELAFVLASAEMLVAMDRSEEALAMLQSQLSYFENSATIRDAVGQLLVGQRDYAQAVNVLRQASILATDDLTIKEHLALALYFNKQYRESGDLIQRLLKDEKFKNRADLYVTLGECQFHQGKMPEARASFEMATQLNAGAPEAWRSLAKVALCVKDFRRSEMSLKKAVAIDPSNSESFLLLGYVRLRQDRLSDALDSFQKASSLDTRDAVSLCMIGYVLEKNGQNSAAVEYYGKALQVKPGDELATRLMAGLDARE